MKTAILLALLLSAAPALAQSGAKPVAVGKPDPRISTMVVYGDDPCPRSSDEEIVVCARQPESERYRIPKELREKKKKGEIPSESWVARARTLDMVSRKGLPNSCSPYGTGGQTGCLRQFLEAARAEREEAKSAE